MTAQNSKRQVFLRFLTAPHDRTDRIRIQRSGSEALARIGKKARQRSQRPHEKNCRRGFPRQMTPHRCLGRVHHGKVVGIGRRRVVRARLQRRALAPQVAGAVGVGEGAEGAGAAAQPPPRRAARRAAEVAEVGAAADGRAGGVSTASSPEDLPSDSRIFS